MNFNIFARKKKILVANHSSLASPGDLFGDPFITLRSQQKPQDIQAILASHKDMEERLKKLAERHGSLEEVERNFLPGITKDIEMRASEKTRGEEESRWLQNGCPTSEAVVVMKPLTLSRRRDFAGLAM